MTTRWPNRIRELREQRGLTTRDLAAIIATHPGTISHYEEGSREPLFSRGVEIALALGCTPADLMLQEPRQAPATFGEVAVGDTALDEGRPGMRGAVLEVLRKRSLQRITVSWPDHELSYYVLLAALPSQAHSPRFYRAASQAKAS